MFFVTWLYPNGKSQIIVTYTQSRCSSSVTLSLRVVIFFLLFSPRTIIIFMVIARIISSRKYYRTFRGKVREIQRKTRCGQSLPTGTAAYTRVIIAIYRHCLGFGFIIYNYSVPMCTDGSFRSYRSTFRNFINGKIWFFAMVFNENMRICVCLSHALAYPEKVCTATRSGRVGRAATATGKVCVIGAMQYNSLDGPKRICQSHCTRFTRVSRKTPKGE